MKASTVDIVFVIDASESMRPCFEGLARNLDQVVRPLQGFNFQVRLGLLALNVGKSTDGGKLFGVRTLVGGYDSVYGAEDTQKQLFTTDAGMFAVSLRSIALRGDEHHLLALDYALDFPFGPVTSHRRVVAMFSDERIEGGAVEKDEMALLPKLIEKAMARKVLLFAAMPSSPSLEILGSLDGAQFEDVGSGDGLASVNFGKLLGQMAKSISVASMQGVEAPYERALFGQDKWGSAIGSFDGLR